MDRFTYPVRLEADPDGGFVVHVPDFGATQAEDKPGALDAAADYIGTWIEMLVEEGRDIPVPSPAQPGDTLVTAPIDTALLGAVHVSMRQQHISKSELARRMGKDEKEVRRLLNPRTGSKTRTFRAVFEALGVHPMLRMA